MPRVCDVRGEGEGESPNQLRGLEPGDGVLPMGRITSADGGRVGVGGMWGEPSEDVPVGERCAWVAGVLESAERGHLCGGELPSGGCAWRDSRLGGERVGVDNEQLRCQRFLPGVPGWRLRQQCAGPARLVPLRQRPPDGSHRRPRVPLLQDTVTAEAGPERDQPVHEAGADLRRKAREQGGQGSAREGDQRRGGLTDRSRRCKCPQLLVPHHRCPS